MRYAIAFFVLAGAYAIYLLFKGSGSADDENDEYELHYSRSMHRPARRGLRPAPRPVLSGQASTQGNDGGVYEG